MSQNTLTMPDTLMEKLHCSICNGYLSCGPVRVLPDGSSICGQCSPPSNDLPIYRDQAFEAVLERVSFPCGFAKHGCRTRLVFGQTAEHESKCEYRSFACPSQGTACYWKGSSLQMLKHFTEAHLEQVVENADWKLQVDKNSDGVIFVSKESVFFIIKYRYKAEDNHLTYDIRFCKNDSILGASYKLCLINDSDLEYTFILKTVDCSIYDDTFYGVQNALVLNLNKYLDVLDNPSRILISVCLTISYNIDDDSRTGEVFLDSLRCTKCRNYLVAPLFLANKNVICGNCSKSDDKPLNDPKLLKLVKETNFPCRWRNCEFVAKNDILLTHELQCQFRQYTCFIRTCDVTFTLDSAINHYKVHMFQYMNNIMSFKISFMDTSKKPQIFTVKNNVIVMLQYFINNHNSNKTMDLLLSSTNPKTIANIHFEHQHCKVKSNSFEITHGILLKITSSQLPPCFKEKDELTGILNI